MTECWICLRSSFQEDGQAQELQLGCGHTFHEACLLEVQEVSGSSKCPACSANGQWSASGLCKVAAVEYLRAIRSTAPETPARFVVVQRCWGYLHDAMALDASHSKSMVLAGILHQSGLGTEKNETMAAKAAKAFEFFSQAHARGDALGTLHLARCYKKGSGCGQDTYRARQLFTEADAAGNTMATLELALMCRSGLGGETNLQRTMELFQKAHKAGDALAAFELGKAYVSGNGMPKDAQKAREHMKAAHDRGYTLATVELGQMYLSGIGGPQNTKLGQEMLLAVDFPPAKPRLDQKSLLQGWLTGTAVDLYQADIDNLNKDDWWQLREPDEEDPDWMLKEAGLYIEEAKTVDLPFGNSKEVMPPPGCEAGGLWRATSSFGSLRVGDPLSVSAEQAGAAKGRRAVVELQESGVSIIAEYVLPKEYDAFMSKHQESNRSSCTPFGGLSSRLRCLIGGKKT